ncbi:MAG: 50S ribosomal protein L19e [Candidatus Aenigmatarchaeota archaeon]|nr:MAG: 50S ribosomal protein L19e [Candidatus Aenigmarchaeota archaeon]
MNLRSQKRLAAKILKCGIDRVKIKQDKEVEEALTREDIKRLINKGLITKIQKKGTSRLGAKKTREQKKKKRRKGPGSRKGSVGARKKKKELWMKRIRALRRLLKELRDQGKIEKKTYTKLYLMAKGNMFRSKKHLLNYLKENSLLKSKK